MSADKTGGPAFPRPGIGTRQDETMYQRDGMTLVDHFAAAAITGLLSDNRRSEYIADLAVKRGIKSEHVMAVCAYEITDAMLAERKKRGIV